MTRADSVLSTPPTNTPMSQTDATSRRRFLSQAAGVAAGGAVLALTTIPPALSANAPAPSVDPMRMHSKLSSSKRNELTIIF
jgi:hypothetical protein